MAHEICPIFDRESDDRVTLVGAWMQFPQNLTSTYGDSKDWVFMELGHIAPMAKAFFTREPYRQVTNHVTELGRGCKFVGGAFMMGHDFPAPNEDGGRPGADYEYEIKNNQGIGICAREKTSSAPPVREQEQEDGIGTRRPAAGSVRDSTPPKDLHRELLRAAEKEDFPAVQRLVEDGADVNADMGEGTPLSWAIGNSHIDMIEFLLQHGADINRHNRTSHRATPMHVAVSACGPEVLRVLFGHNPDVSARDAHGNTPLEFAVEQGYDRTAKLLRTYAAGKKWWQFWK